MLGIDMSNEYMSEKSKREEKASVLSNLKRKGKKKIRKKKPSAVPGGFDDEGEESVEGLLGPDTDKIEKAKKPTQILGSN